MPGLHRANSSSGTAANPIDLVGDDNEEDLTGEVNTTRSVHRTSVARTRPTPSEPVVVDLTNDDDERKCLSKWLEITKCFST